jgi:magnesium-transporting ATPase (P-type)
VKVISGDHTDTVRAIAQAAGVPDADRAVDGRDLPEPGPLLASVMDRANVFGRVTPHQKRAMVRALQSRGHVVAMTGDGVNDVLALKAADVGIAMGSGSNATRAVAELVLVDGDFSHLPEVVAEGRRVIANIERVANLYVSKTVYAFALVLAVGLAGLAFPFLPRHLTLVGSLTIGIPSFFLALEKPSPRAQPGFVSRVIKFAVPTGVIAAASTFLAFGLVQQERVSLTEARTIATLVLLSVGLFVLAIGMRPLTNSRGTLLWGMAALFGVTVLTDTGRTFFDLQMPRAILSFSAIGVVAVTGALMYFALRASGWIRHVPEVVKETQERVRIADPGRSQTALERIESVGHALLGRSKRAEPEPDGDADSDSDVAGL